MVLMHRRVATRISALVGLALGVVAYASCRDATQLRLRITTNVSCDVVRAHGVAISVGGNAEQAEIRSPDTLTRQCNEDGTIGDLFVGPVGGDEDTVAIRVTLGVARDADACGREADGYRGCIVQRRRLRFAPSRTLTIPILLSTSCTDVGCDARSTCGRATECVSSELTDPSRCESADGCPLTADGLQGAADASADGSSNLSDGASDDGSTSDGGLRSDGGSLGGDGGAVGQSLVAGGSHSCALNGVGIAKCWGANADGQLGDGSVNSDGTVKEVLSLPARAVALTAGARHSCAILEDGAMWCWGGNTLGQLGNGSSDIFVTPVAVSGITSAAAAASGGEHTCAVLAGSGAVWCWGKNTNGQLGVPAVPPLFSVIPQDTGLRDVIALSAGAQHTCAATQSGALYCWGDNTYSQAGSGMASTVVQPQLVEGVSGVSVVACGGHHTCVGTTSGVFCFGRNDYGQLGVTAGASGENPHMVQITLAPGQSLTAGGLHTCALRTDRQAACWGFNQTGQLGLGANMTVATSSPTNIVDSRQMVAIAAGTRHSCARAATGEILCWGDNANYQLGTMNIVPLGNVAQISGFP